jgi:hypothetical protein
MKRRGGIGAAALTVLLGCAQPGGNAASDATVPIARLASQGQCGGHNRPAVRWIANAGEWRDLYGRINSQWMNPPPPPAVDFPREGVLLIAMGQRSSAGYGLALADEVATVSDGVLTVRVDWREPPPGYRRAQVMTSPCLLVAVPDAGFTRVRVVDREGRVRLEGER